MVPLSNPNSSIGAVALTKSDATVYSPPFQQIYVGGVGNITVRGADGNDVLFTAVPAGVTIPIAFDKLYSTGTSATVCVGLK